MIGLLYTITLKEPALANSPGGEPNSARSLFYIPGGLVRGTLINAYKGNKNAEEEDFRRLFLNGETRYLNAYPSVDSKRSLPTPLTWQTSRHPKEEDKTLYNIARAEPSEEELKAHPFGFWFLGGDTVHGLDEEWQINIHTQRDAKKGRSTTDAGAVFRYIALPTGMQFQGAILLSQDKAKDDADTLKGLLNGRIILLGKARTAGYGHALIQIDGELPDDWREAGSPFEPPSTITQFTLTLLSPALVRDGNGQFSLDIETALKARLGDNLTIEKKYRQPEIAGGFNRTWGLPLPQVTAIAAGSVFVVSGKIGADKLKKLEETGIGERRAEGFGRVMVEFIQPEWMMWAEARIQKANLHSSGKSVNDDGLAKLMLKRLLRRDLDQAILNAAREAVGDKKNGIANSQLSRWRVILRDSLSRQGEIIKQNGVQTKFDPIQRVKDFHEAESKKRSSSWTKMERARIKVVDQHPRLTEWIETILADPEMLAHALGKESTRGRMLGKIQVEMDEKLNVEYRLRLIDAVLARMEKVNSKEAEVQHE